MNQPWACMEPGIIGGIPLGPFIGGGIGGPPEELIKGGGGGGTEGPSTVFLFSKSFSNATLALTTLSKLCTYLVQFSQSPGKDFRISMLFLVDLNVKLDSSTFLSRLNENR